MIVHSKHKLAIELRLYKPRPTPTTPSAEIPGWRKWAKQNEGTPLLATLILEEKRDGEQQGSGER